MQRGSPPQQNPGAGRRTLGPSGSSRHRREVGKDPGQAFTRARGFAAYPHRPPSYRPRRQLLQLGAFRLPLLRLTAGPGPPLGEVTGSVQARTGPSPCGRGSSRRSSSRRGRGRPSPTGPAQPPQRREPRRPCRAPSAGPPRTRGQAAPGGKATRACPSRPTARGRRGPVSPHTPVPRRRRRRHHPSGRAALS